MNIFEIRVQKLIKATDDMMESIMQFATILTEYKIVRMKIGHEEITIECSTGDENLEQWKRIYLKARRVPFFIPKINIKTGNRKFFVEWSESCVDDILTF